jgi:uncharacterized membrane protein
MACAVVAALQLTLWRSLLPVGALDQIPTWAKVGNAIGLCIFDIELTFALWSVYWHFKGYAALVEPGQCLLARHLIYLVQLLVGLLILSHLRVTGPWGKSFALWSQQEKLVAVVSVLYVILANLNRALPAMFYAWCAWRVADTRPWRVFFCAKVVVGVLSLVPLSRFFDMTTVSSISQVLSAQMVVISIVMLSLLTWIITTEYRGQQRYWTHWLGVGLCVATSVLELASGLLRWFGQY